MKVCKASERLIILSYIAFMLVLIVLSSWFANIAPNGDLTNYNQYLFNLIFYVPPSLWIGVLGLGALLILLCLGTFKGLSPKFEFGCSFVILMILLAVFYGLPNAIEPNPRFTDSWIHGNTAKGILEYGRLQPEKFSYQAYPSSFIFLASLSLVTGADLTLLLRFLPLVLIILFFSLMTIFVRRLSDNPRLAIVSVFVYGLSTLGLSFHFSPEIFGWLLFFMVLIFLTAIAHEYAHKGFVARESFLMLVLLMIGITTTHPVTQFLTLLVFSVFLILLVFRKETRRTKSSMVSLVTLAAIFFSAWSLFFGFQYIANVLDAFKVAFQKVVASPSSSIAASPLQGSYPSVVSALLQYRQVLYVTVLLMSLLGGYFYWKRERNKLNLLLGLLIASAIAAPLTLLGILPLERTVRLAFISISIFSAYLIIMRKRVGALVLIFLVLTIPVNFASLYWGEASKMTHDWEISSVKFASSNFHGVVLSEFRESGVLGYYGNFSMMYNDYYLVGQRPDVFNFTFIEKQGIELVYITQLTILSTSSTGKKLNETAFLVSPFFNCIYSSEYSIILLRNKPGI